MKYMGFQIVFNILKIKKTLQTDWPNTIWPTTWERGFKENFLAESQRQLRCIIQHPKKHTLMDHFFFSKSIMLIYFTALLGKLDKTNNPFQIYWKLVILEHNGNVRHAWPHPRKTSWSNSSFHWYLITCKKQTFYLKYFLRY